MFLWGIRAIVFDAIYFLIRSLLSLVFGLDFGVFTPGVCEFGIGVFTLGVFAFRMALSIMTLCIGSGRVHSVGSITLGSGASLIGASVCAGLVVSSKITRRGSVGTVGSSGIWSSSGALLRMSFSFINAFIWSNPWWLFFPFNACVRSLSAFVLLVLLSFFCDCQVELTESCNSFVFCS